MQRNYAIAAAVVLVILIAGAAIWYRPATTAIPAASTQPPAVNTAFVPPKTVVVHHTVDGTMHTFAGTVDIPSACDSLVTGISSTGTSSITVTLNLQVLETGGAGCTGGKGGTQDFKSSFSPGNASAKVTLGSLTINGAPIPFTETNK